MPETRRWAVAANRELFLWSRVAVVLLAVLGSGLLDAIAQDDDDPLVEIPERDEVSIAGARALVLSEANLSAELTAIAKAVDRAMDPEARQEAMRLIERYRKEPAVLANAAAVAWVQRSPEQALRLAAEAARLDPSNANALNTLAALLAQAGYEEKAIPLLNYLAAKFPNESSIGSNLAAAWLNLGEVAQARTVAARVLARAPDHGIANLTAGIIAESEGRHDVANAHFSKATASNSSPLARRVLREHRQKPRAPRGFLGMLPKTDYFSPGAFEPVQAQRTLAEYSLKLAEKNAYDEQLTRLIEAQEKKAMEETVAESRRAIQTMGAEFDGPYSHLDWGSFFEAQHLDDRLELARKRLIVRMQNLGEIRVELDRTQTPGPIDSPVPSCVRRRPICQAALTKMVPEYELLVGETLYIYRDVANTLMTYQRFIGSPGLYRVAFASAVAHYLKDVRKLNEELPLVPDPCAGQDLTPPPKFELTLPDAGPCPISLDVNVVVATLHMDCKKFGFDFEAGLACSVTKDFTSGETTLTAGVGVKADLGPLADAKGSGQIVLAWDARNNLSFAGVEVTSEASVSGIPGLSGTLPENGWDLARDAGAGSDGFSVTAKGNSITEDFAKAEAKTRLGVEISPHGVDPSLSGEISGKLLGEDLFKIDLPG